MATQDSVANAAPKLLEALRFLLADYQAIGGPALTKSDVPQAKAIDAIECAYALEPDLAELSVKLTRAQLVILDTALELIRTETTWFDDDQFATDNAELCHENFERMVHCVQRSIGIALEIADFDDAMRLVPDAPPWENAPA